MSEEKKKLTVWDVRFELAALRGLAAMHGIPESRFDTIMGFTGETLTWSPPEGTPSEKVKPLVVAHMEDTLSQFVLEQSQGDLRSAIPELLMIGAAMSSLLRKWHVEAHPDTAEQPDIEVRPITMEEFEELKKKGLKTAKAADIEQEEQQTADPDGEETAYRPTGDEGWIGEGENRDVA